MWPLCTANNSLWLLLPFLIGLLTGLWAWKRWGSSGSSYAYEAPVAAPMPAPVPTPAAAAPVRAPEAFVAPPAPAPVAAAPKPVVAPVAAVPIAAAAAALTAIGIPAAVGKADDLLQIKGVGPKLNALLNSLGISRFDQIAAWGASEIAKVDGHLGNFKGRIERDSWVEQGGLLAKGLISQFEAKFGKLDSENQ
jgi:predicted flap endonuclease-1-like 5' DNA nuclease